MTPGRIYRVATTQTISIKLNDDFRFPNSAPSPGLENSSYLSPSRADLAKESLGAYKLIVGRGRNALPRTILVIEDDPDARLLINSVLCHAGFHVVLAADGQEGLEKVPLASPDLIVTDVAMPRLNGLGLIQAIRSTPDFKSVPILAITSFGTERAMEALRAGANRALARPVRNELMLEFVNDLLKPNNRPATTVTRV